jgi:hypothetical protein
MSYRLPDAAHAGRIRAAIRHAIRVREHILRNVEPPRFPRGWNGDVEADWAAYDRSVRKHAQGVAPLSMSGNLVYWRTLAGLFRGEALEREWDTYVEPTYQARRVRQVRREVRALRHG